MHQKNVSNKVALGNIMAIILVYRVANRLKLMIRRFCYRFTPFFKIQVFVRLQKLGLCVSHSSTIKMLTCVGKDFDSKVLAWKSTIESELMPSIPLHQVNNIAIVFAYYYYLCRTRSQTIHV